MLIAGAFVDLFLLYVHLFDKVYFLIMSIEFIYLRVQKRFTFTNDQRTRKRFM